MKGNLKDVLKGKISAKNMNLLRKSFDIVGDIAIIEVPIELKKTEKLVAMTVPLIQKNIKSVYKKEGGHEGKLRIQKLKYLYGEKRTLTEHKENNVRLKLDIAKTYFSPRQSTERKRVYSQIKKPEDVLVMFSGIGPFTISIAKNSSAKSVYAVELNKIAHKYALENVKLNKVDGKVKTFTGDVNKIVPNLNKKFDRIIMPLPKGAGKYLGLAFSVAKKGAAIHFYDFEKQEDIPKGSVEKVKKAAVKSKKKIRILRTVKCGQLAARSYRVCVDLKVI
jgi:tRNA (guanine37-N1)-methyltransferase